MLLNFYLLVMALLVPMLAMFALKGKRELTRRGITLLAIVHIVLLAMAGGHDVFRLLLVTLLMLSTNELCRAHRLPAAISWPLAAVLALAGFWLMSEAFLPAAFVAAVPVIALLLTAAPVRQAVVTLPLALLMVLTAYVTLDVVYAQSPMTVLFLLLLVQLNDNASLLAGKTAGKHRPFPVLSPNKSAEGYLAGMAGMAAAMVIFTTVFPLFVGISLAMMAGMYIAAAVMVNIGDLVFSRLKRNCGIKDYGRLLPGHGGILDRFDSLLLAAPLGFAIGKWLL